MYLSTVTIIVVIEGYKFCFHNVIKAVIAPVITIVDVAVVTSHIFLFTFSLSKHESARDGQTHPRDHARASTHTRKIVKYLIEDIVSCILSNCL